MLERLDHIADVCHVIATSTSIPTQLEHELTTTAANSNAVIEPRDNKGLAVEREVEQEGMVERKGEQGTEAGKELDTGEERGTQEPQKEVRDRPHLPTGHTALDATVCELQRFDWARDVDDSLGLSPVAHTTLQPEPAEPAPTLVNPVPCDTMVDPSPTTFTKAMPADPIPVDPIPNNPISDDVAVDSVCTVRRSATPVEPDLESTASVDPSPCGETVHPVLVDSVPADSVPIDPVPVDPAHVTLNNAVPINPIPIHDKPDPEPTMLLNPINPDSITRNSPIPDNPVPVDPDHFIRSNNTPIGSVCVDPVRVAFVSPVPTDLVDVKPNPTAICTASIESVPVTSTEHAAKTHSNMFDDPFTVATVKTIYANPDFDLSTRVTGVALTFIAHNHISDTDYIFALVAFIIHLPLHLLRTTLICSAFDPVTRTCLIMDIGFCFVKLSCFFLASFSQS
ncbi:hypothetical protein PILCRDRAFT_1980 [Piloderma croceum F 1598]|uniref:Uncharacterized protein n=1 Tax=Piloderma croceum (strain F 1598) TaxID=765440 RepID=A0A0C3GD78_PILCF|nr:hypothetical protein PILCRDRAFT_1980 [Piloderma croceum F 1598]